MKRDRLYRITILLLMGALLAVSLALWQAQLDLKYWKGFLDAYGPTTDQVTDCKAVEAERDQARKESAMWEAAARAMSKEADRRHLDQSFPRVNVPLADH